MSMGACGPLLFNKKSTSTALSRFHQQQSNKIIFLNCTTTPLKPTITFSMKRYSSSRRAFIGKAAMAAAICTLPQPVLPFANRREDFVTADTAYGRIRGQRVDGVNIFKGVPYGGKVSGERRFRRPSPLEPWSGMKDTL